MLPKKYAHAIEAKADFLSQLKLLDLALVTRCASEGSMSRAAESLGNMSEATASRRLRRIETLLKARLFERNTRKMTVTKEGEPLIAQINTALNNLLELQSLSEQMSADASGSLVVGTCPGITELLSQTFLAKFMQDYPDINLQLQQVALPELDDAIQTMDVVLHVGLPKSQSVHILRTARVPTNFYASEAYLSRHGHPEHPQGLSQHRFLSLRHSPWGESVIPWQDADGLVHCESAPHRMECDSIGSMLQLVKQDIGVMLLPDYLMRKQAPELQVLFDGRYGPEFPTYTLLPSARLMPPNVRLFLHELKQIERSAQRRQP